MSTLMEKKRFENNKHHAAVLHAWRERRAEIGAALREIRDDELYLQDGHLEFGEFCVKEFGLSLRQAEQLIDNIPSAVNPVVECN